jgi:hypothetical protein
MSTITTITATTQTNHTRKPKAAASERSGLGGMSRGFISDGAAVAKASVRADGP